MITFRSILAILFMAPMCALAAEFIGSADADTTISLGTIQAGTASGPEFVAGASGVGGVGRALIHFNLFGLPTNAVIDSVKVTLKITKEANVGPDPATFILHRVTRSWNETEASWTSATSGTFWTDGGGDFAATASASQSGGGAGNLVEFGSATLATDVQSWLTGAVVNAGWLLRVSDETDFHSARRFASHDSGPDGPKLTVAYHLPVTLVAPSLLNVRTAGAEFRFDFQANSGTLYAVEFLDSIGTSWQPLTNVTVTSQSLVTISDVRTNDQRFYQVTASAAP
jgi:hypothetical protein